MKQRAPLPACHSRAGGNPAKASLRLVDPLLFCLRSARGIPACAGMTMVGIAAFGFSASAQELKPLRTITVNGMAERNVVPDEAHVQVQVGALNVKLPAAKTEHDQKLRKVMDIAKANGIDEKQIKTNISTIQPQYSYEGAKRNFKGYKVVTSLDITVKQGETVGDLVEKLVAAGLENANDPDAGSMISVNYAISNPDKLRDDLAVAAILNAKTKAEQMASAASANLGPVYQLTEGSAPVFNYPRAMPMMAMAKVADAAAMSPPPGEQEISVTVTVTYELK